MEPSKLVKEQKKFIQESNEKLRDLENVTNQIQIFTRSYKDTLAGQSLKIENLTLSLKKLSEIFLSLAKKLIVQNRMILNTLEERIPL